MATHSSILAWNIPWTEELVDYSPWGCKELDMTEQLSTHTHTHTHTQGNTDTKTYEIISLEQLIFLVQGCHQTGTRCGG